MATSNSVNTPSRFISLEKVDTDHRVKARPLRFYASSVSNELTNYSTTNILDYERIKLITVTTSARPSF